MSSVSVIVPCYRYGAFLEGCLRSILTGQDGVDVRVLVIDDASPDDSADVARRLAERDPRVEVRVHEENQGHIATYNEGLVWAHGDYTVLLSADDRLTPGALPRAAALLDARPEVGFVYGRPLRFADDAAMPRARTGPAEWTVWSGQEWLRRRFRDGTGCVTSPEVMVRTALQKRLGGYDPALPRTADIEMWMRFAAHADVGYLRGVDQAYYRYHAGSMSQHHLRDHLTDLRQRKAAYDHVLAVHGPRISDADRLAVLVGRRLAREALWRASRAYDRRRTHTAPVDALVEFARAADPRAHRSVEYAGLQVRRLIGPAVMPYLQPLVLSAVTHKVREHLWWESWKRRGV